MESTIKKKYLLLFKYLKIILFMHFFFIANSLEIFFINFSGTAHLELIHRIIINIRIRISEILYFSKMKWLYLKLIKIIFIYFFFRHCFFYSLLYHIFFFIMKKLHNFQPGQIETLIYFTSYLRTKDHYWRAILTKILQRARPS